MVIETDEYTIHIQPDRVWEFAQKKKLMSDDKKFILASSSDGYEVCLNLENEEPEVEVYYDNDVVESTFVFSDDDCTKYVRELYGDYITSSAETEEPTEVEEAFEALVTAIVGKDSCLTMQEYKNYFELLDEFTERIFEECDACEKAEEETA